MVIDTDCPDPNVRRYDDNGIPYSILQNASCLQRGFTPVPE